MEQYNVTGMTCAACQARVEKVVSKVPGVTSVSVNLLTNSMGVEGTALSTDIVAAVEKAGYHASVKGAEKESSQGAEALADTETPKLLKRLIISLIFLMPLMYLSMGHMMWNWPLPGFLNNNHVGMGLAQLLFTVIIMVINQRFFISGFTSLIHRAPNMDTLVAMGATAAFSYSTYALFAMTAAQTAGNNKLVMSYMHEFYFESAAMILTLITLGKTLEAYSKGKTTDALKSLMNLAPKMATVVRNGQEQIISAEQVKKGDIFLVKPGESIPVDGIVLEGNSAIDEAALTGESIPVDKAEGDNVSAATINQSGFLKCEATRVGEDTTLSQIIKMVSDAAATKAPIAKIADKVSGIFVPAVITIAVITIIGWLLAGQTVGFALARGISVLVISCPCALGLATPVAIDIVALDKTGTITTGQPKVTDIFPADGISEKELLEAAFALEKKSEHPLAKAIVEYGNEKKFTVPVVEDFQAVPGNGLTGTLNNKTLIGGNLLFIEKSLSISEKIKHGAEQLASAGKTPLFFAKENRLLGMIAVADVIKEDSPQAIKELKAMGIHVVMLTGDNERTAKAIGEQAGVDNVIAGVLPDGKESVIRALGEKGKVAMVGDGINDAPALTRADVGIAIGAGTDVAMDAADIVLMKSKLADVPAAIRLSRGVLRNIHENLFWAFFYNTIGIPLAAGLLIPVLGWKLNPMFGAAAMSLSSFCVVTNALRLNLLNIRSTKKDKKKQKAIDVSLININNNEKKEVNEMTKTMNIKGMMCGHCEAAVKKALEALPEVASAEVSHEKGTAVVTLEKEIADDVLKKTVEDKDYEVVEIK